MLKFTAFKEELTKIENLLLKNQYPKTLQSPKSTNSLKLTKSTIQHLNKMKILTQKMKRKQKPKTTLISQQFTQVVVQ